MGINQSSPRTANYKNYRTLQITKHDIIFKKHALPNHYHPKTHNLFYSSLTNKFFIRHTIKINSNRLQTVYHNFLYGLYNSDLIIAPTYLQLGQKRQSYTINFYTQYLKRSIKEIQQFQSIQLAYQLLIQALKGIQKFYNFMHNYYIEQKNIIFTKGESVRVKNQSDLMLQNIDPIKTNPCKQIYIVNQVLKIFDKRTSKRKNQVIFQNLVFEKIGDQQISIKSALDTLIQSANQFSTQKFSSQNSGVLTKLDQPTVFKLKNCSSQLLYPQERINISQNYCRQIVKQLKYYKNNCLNLSNQFNQPHAFENTKKTLDKPQAKQFKFLSPSRTNDNQIGFKSNLIIRPSPRTIKNLFRKQNAKVQTQVNPFLVENICQRNNQKKNNGNSFAFYNQKPSLNIISTAYSGSQHQNQQSIANFAYNIPNRNIQIQFKPLRRNHSELIQYYPKNNLTTEHQSQLIYQNFKQQFKLDFKKSLTLNTSLVQGQSCLEKINPKQIEFHQTDFLEKEKRIENQQAQNTKHQIDQTVQYFIPIRQTNRQYDLQQITQHFLSEQNSNRTNFQSIKRQKNSRTKTLKPNIIEKLDFNARKNKSVQFSLDYKGKVKINLENSECHYEHQQQQNELSDAQTLNKIRLSKKQEQPENQSKKTQRKVDTIKQSEQSIQQSQQYIHSISFLDKIKKGSFIQTLIHNKNKDRRLSVLSGLATIKSIKQERSQSQVSYVIQG